jgi:hypothetical protein
MAKSPSETKLTDGSSADRRKARRMAERVAKLFSQHGIGFTPSATTTSPKISPKQFRWQDALGLVGVLIAVAGMRLDNQTFSRTCVVLAGACMAVSFYSHREWRQTVRCGLILAVILIDAGILYFIYKPPFAVTVLRELPSSTGHRTPLVVRQGDRLIPTNDVLLITIKNDQSSSSLISRIVVKLKAANGKWITLRRVDTLDSQVYGNEEGECQECLNHAPRLEYADLLKRISGRNYIAPGQTVDGMLFFKYPPEASVNKDDRHELSIHVWAESGAESTTNVIPAAGLQVQEGEVYQPFSMTVISKDDISKLQWEPPIGTKTEPLP